MLWRKLTPDVFLTFKTQQKGTGLADEKAFKERF